MHLQVWAVLLVAIVSTLDSSGILVHVGVVLCNTTNTTTLSAVDAFLSSRIQKLLALFFHQTLNLKEVGNFQEA